MRSTWPPARAATPSGWPGAAGARSPSTSPRSPSTKAAASPNGSRSPTGFTWICVDVIAWAPRPNSYDLAVIAYLHLPADDLRTAVSRAASGLSAGGTIVVVGHDLSNLDGGTGGPQDPAVLYTPQAITTVLEAAGLTVIKADTVERHAANGTALDTLVTATFHVPSRELQNVTWAGCGQHVDEVMAGVPAGQRCPGHPRSETSGSGSRLLSRIRTRRRILGRRAELKSGPSHRGIAD